MREAGSKKHQGRKRWVWGTTAAFAGALGLGLALHWGRRKYEHRQVVGRLSFDAGQVPAMNCQVDPFTLTWETAHGGRLVVRHQSNPDRILWSTLPGWAFVGTGRGQERVTDARGHFYIRDRLEHACPHQTIERILLRADHGQVSIAGKLHGSRAERPAAYTLAFSVVDDNQLRFALALDDERYNRSYLTYASDRQERFFGFGEQFSFFDMKGRRLPLIVSEQGIGRGAQPITFFADLVAGAGGRWHSTYAGVPHYISSRLRSLFLENYAYSVFDLRKADRVHVQLFSTHMAGHILYGESPAALIETYTDYAGRMRLLPDWILEGAIVGIQGGTGRVREILARLQKHDVPIVGLWLQDWVGQRITSFGRQLWWNWALDKQRFPDWGDLRSTLESQGIRLLVYVNSFLADVSERGAGSRNLFREARERGYLVRDRAGEPHMIRTTSFEAGLVDLTNPAAWDWIKQVLKEEVIGIGAQGWMADYAEALPYDAQLCSGETAALVHNRYPELWAQVNREAVEESKGGADLVFFCRSGYRHSPAYATLFFLGDQLVSWDRHDGIKTAVTGILSGGMSGYSLNHSDIGGFTTIGSPLKNYYRSKELLLRWMELNAFSSIYRSHEGNRPEKNVQVYTDEETLAHFGRMAKVYQAWAFYRKQLMREAAQTGLPVVRHPFIHYPGDRKVYELSYQQFMIGSEWMVAPVLDPHRDRVSIYLPAGRWVHVWSGRAYGDPAQGVRITAPAPLGKPAVFYRKGSAAGAQFAANLKALGMLD